MTISYQKLVGVLLIFFLSTCNAQNAYPYKIGSGIYDITGPVAEVGLMGYANVGQIGAGLHFRLRARAFVIVDQITQKRVAYVNLDLCFATIWLKKLVVESLQSKLPNLYTYENVLLSGTHTHSGPAGYSWYTTYDIMCLGYKKKNLETIANGIVQAILKAHQNLEPGRILIKSDELVNPASNINRSPSAYLNNPASERASYKYDVDKDAHVIRFEGQITKEIGVINWFAVHGTSMNNTNRLTSGDNKGYASYLFEMKKNGNSSLPGMGPFVAAFTNSNEGDVSPNVLGFFCDNGDPCDFYKSTCDGAAQGCHSYGPGKNNDNFENVEMIGRQQFEKALSMFENATVPLTGSVDYRHTFINMENILVEPAFSGLNTTVQTCKASLGDSFAAGTVDGAGDFDFTQGSNSTNDNPFWNMFGHLLSAPPAEQVKCHYPKPILLYTGGVHIPTAWSPSILPIQLLKIGQLYIIGVPAEFTTMAGRRLRATIKSALLANGAPQDLVIVIAGLSNGYSQYVTTPEEYDIQRYEGASTLFGPQTLNAYRQEISKLAVAIATNKTVAPGDLPVDYSSDIIDISPGVLFDDGPIGDVLTDVNKSYKVGSLVSVTFYSASPRNNYRIQDTFLTVEQKVASGWKVIATDSHWETKFYWRRHENIELEESYATIEWNIPSTTELGTYRIRHFGTKKSILGTETEFVGTSSEFTVTL